ncbi:LysE family translocator [Actinomadura litoris]|uniref:LysE family translocator n=1 Tax=Actinomadura litoris TaxID=2678616 RepID=A0A7K1L1E7_9ACTN|nr:LysE family translocator [Actinomadura litoris]MUN38221.1 LysE family translocator [Actinomadura litoris]
MLTAAIAFAGVALLINITPGVDTLLVLRTSISDGRTGGVIASLGVMTGCLAWGLAAAIGLTALLTASHVAYETLRICGALYLLYLGASALWHARRKTTARTSEPEIAAEPRGHWAAFRAGVGTNLLNPKAGVFYMSLIPQFMPEGAPTFSTTLLFTGIDLAELVVWYWLVSGVAAALAERLRRPSVRRRLEQFTGIAFLGFAANLATERP